MNGESLMTIPLIDDHYPPTHKINPDYKQQPGNTRKCEQCGKTHDTIVEDMRTGERVEEFSNCKSCLFSGAFSQTPLSQLITEWGGEKIKVKTSNNGWVDIVDELNRLKNE